MSNPKEILDSLSPTARIVLAVMCRARDSGINGNGSMNDREIAAVCDNCMRLRMTPQQIMETDDPWLLFRPITVG